MTDGLGIRGSDPAVDEVACRCTCLTFNPHIEGQDPQRSGQNLDRNSESMARSARSNEERASQFVVGVIRSQ